MSTSALFPGDLQVSPKNILFLVHIGMRPVKSKVTGTDPVEFGVLPQGTTVIACRYHIFHRSVISANPCIVELLLVVLRSIRLSVHRQRKAPHNAVCSKRDCHILLCRCLKITRKLEITRRKSYEEANLTLSFDSLRKVTR